MYPLGTYFSSFSAFGCVVSFVLRVESFYSTSRGLWLLITWSPHLVHISVRLQSYISGRGEGGQLAPVPRPTSFNTHTLHGVVTNIPYSKFFARFHQLVIQVQRILKRRETNYLVSLKWYLSLIFWMVWVTERNEQNKQSPSNKMNLILRGAATTPTNRSIN